MNHNLSDIEFSRVCKVIASHLGLHFPIDRQAYLNRNLALAAIDFGFQDTTRFIQWLISPAREKDQIECLAPYVTNSETYFWREPQVFAAFTQNILTELVNSKKDKVKSINIWCSACSTGEEAYSIAIALHRTITGIKDWNIKILATDINSKSLLKARKGVYGTTSFRNSPPWLKSGYFKIINDKEYEIIDEIKKMVTFSEFNLTHENFLTSICNNHKMDIIFCRNVLMYFTSEWAAGISQNLYNCLSDKGWLVVSSCELSSDLFPQYAPDNFPGAVLYRKSKDKFSGNFIQTDNYNRQISFSSLPTLAPDTKLPDQLFGTDSKYSVLNENGYNKTGSFNQPEVALKDAAEPQARLKNREDILNENKNSIRLLANRGHLKEALSVCNEAIASDKLAPGLYLLRASILQELDKSYEAIKSLKQAIYIYPDYLMGHFTLGNLFFKQRNIKNAKRYFNNAIELLNTISNSDIPAESEGLSAKYLREIILSNLQIQKSI